jgi:hypothetical protein
MNLTNKEILAGQSLNQYGFGARPGNSFGELECAKIQSQTVQNQGIQGLRGNIQVSLTQQIVEVLNNIDEIECLLVHLAERLRPVSNDLEDIVDRKTERETDLASVNAITKMQTINFSLRELQKFIATIDDKLML